MSAKGKFDLTYANEKLYSAVRYMATSSANLPDRIAGAFASFHTLLPPHNLKNIPSKVQSKLVEIHDRLTREKAKGSEGDVHATLNVMTEDDARDLAEEIFDLYYAVHDLHEAQK
jgi:hypothetical protein